VATCPTEALKFGERDDLLKYAQDRLVAQPARYLNHIYGETENGGTSYLILSHVPFNELGLPDLPSRPVKDISEEVMGLTIPFALGWGVALTGLAAGVHLVNQKKEADAKKLKTSEPQSEEKK
jgi:formate dehydrogenase iron-sulfur subunit